MNLGPRHIPSGFQLFLMGPIHKRALPERAHIISCVDLPCNRMPALFYFSPHRCTYSKGGERNGMMRGLSQYIIYHFFFNTRSLVVASNALELGRGDRQNRAPWHWQGQVPCKQIRRTTTPRAMCCTNLDDVDTCPLKMQLKQQQGGDAKSIGI